MSGVHGGDIYHNDVKIDFSVNVNPLGIPKPVKTALYEAVGHCNCYPDIRAEELRQAVSHMLAVPKQSLIFGNGASELFLAVVHAVRPKKTVIPVPSFFGYEYAAEAGKSELIFYETKEENGFCMTEDFHAVLTDDVDLLFLANPNNPTGKLIDRESLKKLFGICREKGIYVVLDECFIEFCSREFSMLTEVKAFDNLILVRAFTKIFSIPGVRLGYLICSNRKLARSIQSQLPEWNLSCFAQAAGRACVGQNDFIKKTAGYIQKERQFLQAGLRKTGFQVFPSRANFILFFSEKPLYEPLLERGILIRDCRNFKGLRQGFYRVAVKTRKENETLLREVYEIEKNRTFAAGGN